MPSLKEYKAKLVSLKNTRKMTKTMKMVAASKLYKTMDAQRKAALYSTKLNEMISRLAASVDPTCHPLLDIRTPTKNVLLLVITSDKGLCGGFNNNLIKFVQRWLSSRQAGNIQLSFCGRRGNLFFKSRAKTKTFYDGVTAKVSYADAARIGKDICQSFLQREFDEVYVAYNHFVNPLTQKPAIVKLLPIAPQEVEGGVKIQENYLFEPSQDQLLAALLPKIIEFKIYYALLENAAGENGARMTAMDNATSNAGSLIDLYTLLRNRARQASITKELIEIISGAEALKG